MAAQSALRWLRGVLSNMPEGWSSSAVSKDCKSTRFNILLWVSETVAASVGLAGWLRGVRPSPDVVIGGVQAVAVGAVITMLADTMTPEGKGGRRSVW